MTLICCTILHYTFFFFFILGGGWVFSKTTIESELFWKEAYFQFLYLYNTAIREKHDRQTTETVQRPMFTSQKL